MILPITLYGNPVLREKGQKITEITDEVKKLADDMIETMRDAQGIGLAAQQIGKAIQLTVIDIPEGIEEPSRMWVNETPVSIQDHMPMILINPVLEKTKKKNEAEEGCLSFPGVSVDVRRSARVHVEATTLEGERIQFDADGLLGRCIQHETDHLNGVLFIDYADQDVRKSIKAQLDDLRAEGESQIKEE
ncbi:MAG: peptide deformylase [Verrucomicrobiota bacterium]